MEFTGQGSRPKLDWSGTGVLRLLSALTRARAASAEKHACADHISEVIPTTGVGEIVNTNICEQAADEAEYDKETVEQSREETRWIERFRPGLSRATGDDKCHCHDRQKNEYAASLAPTQRLHFELLDRHDNFANLLVRFHVTMRFHNFRQRKHAINARLEIARRHVIENVLQRLGLQPWHRKYFAHRVPANGQAFA